MEKSHHVSNYKQEESQVTDNSDTSKESLMNINKTYLFNSINVKKTTILNYIL